MICISSKQNPKLLQTFNNDPDWDISIITSQGQLQLVLAYLSIDSEYFEEFAPGATLINLSNLNQKSLKKVLRAQYGQQLYAKTVEQLQQFYKIIQFLKINEYKVNIEAYIRKHPQLFNQLDLVEFCFSRLILINQVIKHHYNLKLSAFASIKNVFKLNKVSQNTLNGLLIQYSRIKGQQADQVINVILQNYIARINSTPNKYFLEPKLKILRLIWEKYHHILGY